MTLLDNLILGRVGAAINVGFSLTSTHLTILLTPKSHPPPTVREGPSPKDLASMLFVPELIPLCSLLTNPPPLGHEPRRGGGR